MSDYPDMNECEECGCDIPEEFMEQCEYCRALVCENCIDAHEADCIHNDEEKP